MGRLNHATSYLFVATAMYAYLCEHFGLSIACFMCACSSIGYHGSVVERGRRAYTTRALRVLDMFITRVCIVTFLIEYASLQPWYVGAVIATLYSAISYDSEGSEIRHSAIHVVSNLGICCLCQM